MSFYLTPRIRLEALVAGLLFFAGCAFPEEAAPSPEGRPESCPASEPLPVPAPAPEPAPEAVPRDNCLGCGMGYVPAPGKLFLDAYSVQKS